MRVDAMSLHRRQVQDIERCLFLNSAHHNCFEEKEKEKKRKERRKKNESALECALCVLILHCKLTQGNEPPPPPFFFFPDQL
jgi:hypothetical protein